MAAMSNALLRTVRSFSSRVSSRVSAHVSAPQITCRSFSAANAKAEDVNKDGISDDANTSPISIWWDIQKCMIPKDGDVCKVVLNIRDAVSQINCIGPMEMWGFGDVRAMPPAILTQLHNVGVKLRHRPRGCGLADEILYGDLIAWANEHPPPYLHMVISDKPDDEYDVKHLQKVMEELRSKGYEFLLAQPGGEKSPPLIEGAKKVWEWETFLAGALG